MVSGDKWISSIVGFLDLACLQILGFQVGLACHGGLDMATFLVALFIHALIGESDFSIFSKITYGLERY